MSRSSLAQQLCERLGDEQVRRLDPRNGWPASCQVRAERGWIPAHFYVAQVGKGGRGASQEARIQNPSAGNPITDTAGTRLYLLGVAKSGDVLVSWDAYERLGRETRFSAFVPAALLDKAAENGWAEHVSASGERVIAFRPEMFPRLVEWLGDNSKPAEQQEIGVMTKAVETDDTNDGLSELSQNIAALSHGPSPAGHGPDPEPIEADEVDWASNSWLAALYNVRAWLALDDSFDLDAGPMSAATQLFDELSETASECFVEVEGSIRLRPDGIAILGDRLGRAVSHKQTHDWAIESDDSPAKAAAKWVEAWEDDGDDTHGTPLEVQAKVESTRIVLIRLQAEEGTLILNPSYQRDSVWSDSESKALIDSILRGIPLPSIILNQRKGDPHVEIVDGKQRLTAILRFIGRHPDGMKFARKKSEEAEVSYDLFHTHYKEWRRKVRKAVGLESSEERKNFLPFPFGLAKTVRANDPLATLAGKYYYEIKEEIVKIQGKDEHIRWIFESPSTDYELPLIRYSDTDIQQIHRVFGLYNKQGKKLNATEVRNAIYHHLHITRILLLLSGDSEDVASLAPYLTDKDLDTTDLGNLLSDMGVSTTRFNRTKLVSWVVAILAYHVPPKKDGSAATPGSTKLVESLLSSVEKDKKHPLRTENGCLALARALLGAASLLDELRDGGIAPEFTGLKSPGEKWEDLPAVSALAACVIASLCGIESITPEARTAFKQTTGKIKRLQKQQAKWQWGYIANAVLVLLEALGVTAGHGGDRLDATFGTNPLPRLQGLRVKA